MKRTTLFVLIAALIAVEAHAAVRDVPLPRSAPLRDVPLPRPRPMLNGDARPAATTETREPWPRPASSELPSPAFPTVATEPSECEKTLGAVAVFTPLPVLIGPGECGSNDVVRLEAVILKDAGRVPIAPPATLRCPMAAALAEFVREDLTGAAGDLGAALAGLSGYDSYECRGRNRVVGAKISEHGKANAIDIRGIRLANGRIVEFTDMEAPRVFRDRVRVATCARFTTVLGPGSDGYHENHIHLDLAQRRGGYRMCQWDVRDPLPPGAIPGCGGAVAEAASGVAIELIARLSCPKCKTPGARPGVPLRLKLSLKAAARACHRNTRAIRRSHLVSAPARPRSHPAAPDCRGR